MAAAGWVRILEGANTLGAGLVRLSDQGLEGCALASGGGNNLDEHRYVDAGDDIHALAGGRELRTGVVGATTEEVNEQQGFFCLGRLNDAGVLFDEIFGALARRKVTGGRFRSYRGSCRRSSAEPGPDSPCAATMMVTIMVLSYAYWVCVMNPVQGPVTLVW